MPDKEFGVFLSHNSADKDEVVKLATKLKELGFNPWFDAWHLNPGEPWLPAIERALANSDSCAVAVGTNGFGKVHKEEMWVALQHAMESKRSDRQYRVIPVLLPTGTRGDRAKLPPFLAARTWVEFYRSIDDPAALDKLAKAIRGETASATARLPNGECPYRGLAYFDVQHAGLFFGRGVLTDWLLSRLRGTASTEGPTRFLAIVGASGSGKSSLARAGVLAKLQAGELPGSQNWPQIICRPENRPLESLATALAGLEGDNLGPIAKSELIANLTKALLESPDRLHLVAQGALPANDRDWRMVVFVDQFEELFTLNVVEATDGQPVAASSTLSADRVAFVRNLLRAATISGGRTVVILTMRADFYGKCAALSELATAVSAHQELVGAMSVDDLQRAIVAPAQLGGSDIDSGLVELLTKEVADKPGALPLLEYALAELWRRSRKLGFTSLTTAAYRELGGWEGALSRRADDVLKRFRNTPQELLCRELFLRLVQPGEGTEATKRLVRWEELNRANASDTAALEQTVRTLVNERLITTSRDGKPGAALQANSTIEVIHEALIRGWGELRKWLDAEGDGLRIHRQLTEAANDWVSSHADPAGRDPSRLYIGKRLADVRNWAEASRNRLSQRELLFLDTSEQAETQRAEREERLRAEGLVHSLMNADTAQVPVLVQELGNYRRWADPLLHQSFEKATNGSAEKLHAALALVPVDAGRVAYLRDQLLVVNPAQFAVIQRALWPHCEAIKDTLWGVATAGKPDSRDAFQAACALATFAPEDGRWTTIAARVADYLLTREASELVAWRESLSPARKQLLQPLAAIYRNTGAREQARTYATETLANYAADDPDALFDLLADADQFQFPAIYNKLADHRDRLVSLAEAELQKQAAADAGEEDRESLARRQANAAVALVRLGATEPAWPVLKHSPDPRARSCLIHWLGPLGANPRSLIERLDDEPDVTIRRALLLALGEFSEAQLSMSEREPLIARLSALYETDPDAGMHAAAEWLLRNWNHDAWLKQTNAKLAQTSRVPGTDSKRIGPAGSVAGLTALLAGTNARWYVNTQAQTFVILQADEFLMGSPTSEPDRSNDEVQHRRRIGRTLAIAAKPVTREEYQRFLDDAGNRDVTRYDIDQYSRSGDSPQVAMDWYDSARYCNWLSRTEGIPENQWCYEPNSDGKYAEGMQPAADFLERSGYRLPTEAEWEFACRAGAATSRYYGSGTALLPKFAWFIENSPGNYARPTGLLKPNDFGLFDSLGNVWEWCHDVYAKYPVNDSDAVINDDGDKNAVEEKYSRVLRGASFRFQSSSVRSCYRNLNRPGYLSCYFGVRPARTYR